MDFLAICQRVRQECGVAGTGPSTVLSQVGVLAKIVNRTARAWVDIQALRPYWKFLRNQTTFALTIDQREYSVVDDLSLTSVDKWDKDLSYIYETSTADERQLLWDDYKTFRMAYRTYPAGRPTIVVEGLDGTIAFDRTPDVAYTVTLDYWMTPELLAADSDVPACPEQYHDAIVWKAVMMFAGGENATELFMYAKSMYGPVRDALILDQGEMPTRVYSYPIAHAMGTYRGPFPRP